MKGQSLESVNAQITVEASSQSEAAEVATAKLDKSKCDCCVRGDEYNGFSTGPLLFKCPVSCPCHD